MLVKINGISCDINIEKYPEIITEVLAQKSKIAIRTEKIAKTILKHRKLIAELLAKNETELKQVITEIKKDKLNLDRIGLKKSSVPFKKEYLIF